tara:strand:+ start:1168 stop:2670 length:1503 start_codon:yes stop_codon:yes gene_type:complete
MFEVNFHGTQTVATAIASGGFLFDGKGDFLKRGDSFKLLNNDNFYQALSPTSSSVHFALDQAKKSGSPAPGDMYRVISIKQSTNALSVIYVGNTSVRSADQSHLFIERELTSTHYNIVGEWESSGVAPIYSSYKINVKAMLQDGSSDASTTWKDNEATSSYSATLSQTGSTGLYVISISSQISIPSTNATSSSVPAGILYDSSLVQIIGVKADGTEEVVDESYGGGELITYSTTTQTDPADWVMDLVATYGSSSSVLASGITNTNTAGGSIVSGGNGSLTNIAFSWDDAKKLGIDTTILTSNDDGNAEQVSGVTFSLEVTNASTGNVSTSQDLAVMNPVEMANPDNTPIGDITFQFDRMTDAISTGAIANTKNFFIWLVDADAPPANGGATYWDSAGTNATIEDAYGNNVTRYYTAQWPTDGSEEGNITLALASAVTAGSVALTAGTYRLEGYSETEDGTKAYSKGADFTVASYSIGITGTIPDVFLGQNLDIAWTNTAE